LGNLSPRRDYIFVEDVAFVLAWAALKASKPAVVNIGTGRSWSVLELVETLRTVTGRRLKIKVDPERVRPTDRPNLQAANARLLDIVPGLTLSGLEDGLRRTLSAILPDEVAASPRGEHIRKDCGDAV
jgi:UDP-glucose 4-epimerase